MKQFYYAFHMKMQFENKMKSKIDNKRKKKLGSSKVENFIEFAKKL